MIIGKRGAMLKRIGTEARQDMEQFLSKKVFLEIYVRVSEGWKDSQQYLRGFGYE
jgi:GTP-binding protein Era